MKAEIGRLIRAADLGGTFVFAIGGAEAAIANRLDLLGVMVLAFATALGGGIIRDVLLGTAPPQALRGWTYATTAFAGGLLTFILYQILRDIPAPVFIGLDAAGLALFAVAGTEKALAYNMTPLIAVLMGTITAVGGGTMRDVLLAHVPAVLRVDLYATSALAGATLMVILRQLGMKPKASALLGGIACFSLRMASFWLHWHLPLAGSL
jgi:uncharacterized membrane protein YeiH